MHSNVMTQYNLAVDGSVTPLTCGHMCWLSSLLVTCVGCLAQCPVLDVLSASVLCWKSHSHWSFSDKFNIFGRLLEEVL